MRRIPATRHTVADDCPVERAIHTIGGKWKMLVLRSLLLNGKQRYNDLLLTVTGINAKELTRNLRDLQKVDLVAREPGDGNGATAYGVTELGSMLLPAFEYLAPFGQRLPSRAR
jgi:DNA-binding HxlR family transcriptional regulator